MTTAIDQILSQGSPNRSEWIAAFVAFATASLLLPVVIRLCARWKHFDPAGPLKIHARNTPRLGGVAMAPALALGIALGAAWGGISPSQSWMPTWWPFFAAFFVVWAAGVADDVRRLSPLVRFAAQVGAAAMLWHGGWRIPFTGDSALGLAALCLFVVGFANAFNFLDGADGLAAGVAGIAGAGYLVALHGAITLPIAAVSAALTAACAAFLLWNFPPAKIFLGDSGSTVLGFIVAFLSLDFWRATEIAAGTSVHSMFAAQSRAVELLLFPFCVALLPLTDATLAILRRLLRGGSPFRGDRSHFYDLLLDRGWSQRNVALLCYGIAAGLALVAWTGLRFGTDVSLAGFGASACALGAWMIHLGALRAQKGLETKPGERIASRGPAEQRRSVEGL
ncbi:MAG: MraY family glycosyltransferase [Candidatus Acidiferrales bacterium]